MGGINLIIIDVNTPIVGHRSETEQFYNDLQAVLDKINKNDYIIITRELSARTGVETIDD